MRGSNYAEILPSNPPKAHQKWKYPKILLVCTWGNSTGHDRDPAGFANQ